MTFTEVHKHFDMPKSSLHNLLTTLEETGFLHRDAIGSYSVGLTAFEVGSAHPVRTGLLRTAAPVLRALVREYNETCHLGVLDGRDVVYVERLESTQHVRLSTTTGGRVPAYATGIGKALLALTTDEEVAVRYADGLPALTDRTITDVRTLCGDLAQVRSCGYATDDQESTMGVRCVGVATQVSGWPAVGISMSLPLQRFPDERFAELGPVMVDAAAQLRERLVAVSPGFSIDL